jgi:fructokinase
MEHVPAITLRDLLRTRDFEAIAQAAYSAGQTLAALGHVTLPTPGWITTGLRVAEPLLPGSNALPRSVDRCLESPILRARLTKRFSDRFHDFVWTWAPRLAQLESESHLVHGDYGKRNLLVRRDCAAWKVVAVLDWEYAVSGSPLADIGHLLRYECASRPLLEPAFSTGFLNDQGRLPNDWRQLARVLDSIALCESLTRECIPDDIVAELTELLRAATDDREPVFSG